MTRKPVQARKKPVAIIGRAKWKEVSDVRRARKASRYLGYPGFPLVPAEALESIGVREKRNRQVASRKNGNQEFRYWNNPVIHRRLARERLSLVKDLIAQGFNVKLFIDESKASDAEKRFAALAEKAGARVAKTRQGTAYDSPFIRDTFTYIAGIRFVHPLDIRKRVLENPERVMKRGEKPARKWYYSFLGEGGAVVNIANQCVLVSKLTARKAAPEIEFLESRGLKVFKMPAGMIEIFKVKQGNKTMPVYRKTHHIDLFINRVPGKPLLLADPEYYHENRQLIDSIAGALKYRVLVVPEKEKQFYPANFLELGENKILVNRGAKKTIRMLRENNVKVVPTTRSLKASALLGSGVRCAVNLPKHSLKRLGLKA